MKYFQDITDKEEEEMLRVYERTPKSFRQDIEAIQKWCKTQTHFPEAPGYNHIRCILFINKCCIEATKTTIDMYYTMKSSFPEIYENANPFFPRMKHAQKLVYCIPMPNMIKDYSRLMIIKVKDTVDDLDLDAIFAYGQNIIEIRFLEEFCVGHHLLFDFSNVRLGHLKNISPVTLKKLVKISETLFSLKIEGYHLINTPQYLDSLIFLVKSFVKAKIVSRIFIHRNLQALWATIPRETLPRDYGGMEKSLDELEEMMNDKFEEYKSHFAHLDQLRVNEERRPEKTFNSERLGFYGNFKKLDVD